jgi:glyoxylase-like metal-dependent hydrolase (beta-lactamase superfamily II)
MSKAFSVGGLEITCFGDGILRSSVDYVVGMDRAQAMKVSGAADDGAIFIPVNNFVFRRGNAIVLIDVGAAKSLQPTLGKLPADLREAGIRPEAVTHILLTHLHPDHANGLIDEQQAAVFPNAEVFLHETEYAFWTGDPVARDSEVVKRFKARNRLNVAPYRDRINLIHDGTDVLGCAPVLAPGHSPGHTCWRIGTDGEDLFVWGDLVHFSSIQIGYPRTGVTYDLDSNLASTTRVKILEMIVADRLLIAGAHITPPGFGRVVRKGLGFQLEPGA